MLPAFILDGNWNILAMNPAFRCLAGDEWGCTIGSPIGLIIDALDNSREVKERAHRLFFGASSVPEIDHEPRRFTSRKYGAIVTRKFGVRLSGPGVAPDTWLIQLNILSAERSQELFDDLLEAIGRHADGD